MSEPTPPRPMDAQTRALLRRCLRPSTRVGQGDLRRYASAHRFALEQANALRRGHGSKLDQAAVASVYVLAIAAGAPLKQVARFAAVLHTGEIAAPSETAAIRARDWCLLRPMRTPDELARAQRCLSLALRHFIAGAPTHKLRVPQEMQYPWLSLPPASEQLDLDL